MMKRIVKMTFDPEKVGDFKKVFNASCEKIRAFEGCEYLELWQDINQPNIFFTYSFWQGPEYLENYRQSELFKGVWSDTKKLFIAKPQAWSIEVNKVLK